jgi:hypothetical protein
MLYDSVDECKSSFIGWAAKLSIRLRLSGLLGKIFFGLKPFVIKIPFVF